MTPSLVDDELELEPMQVLDLHNGHANGHSDGHANGHANGVLRRRDDFDLSEVATFLSSPLVSTGFAHGGGAAFSANGALAPAQAPAIPFHPHAPRGVYALAGKRALDVLGGLLVLLVASPVILLAALAVRLTSRGPAFYKSTRLGRSGRPFTFYKLRSMVSGADRHRHHLSHLNECDGPVFKISRDPRVTVVGRFLRTTSLDELPQLWNVLRGDMSLVGPRPPLPDEVSHYQPWQMRRLDVRPGLTCLWQISGRSRIGFEEWMRLDLEYINRRSFRLDLQILLRTIPAVLSREGAY